MALDRLIAFYHHLTPESVERFSEFYAADAYFKDPFNEVRGIDAIKHIFTHIVWTMRCYTLECSAMPPRYHWATPDELREEISLPTAFRQFVDAE